MDSAGVAQRKKTLFDIPQHFFHPRNGAEEFGRIGRPELLVKRNRGCETSHQGRPRVADQATNDSSVLSAAKRGRGRDPLRSNGEVRWCFVQRRRADCEATAHLTLPALARGSPPSPPASRAERASERRRRAETLIAIPHYGVSDYCSRLR